MKRKIACIGTGNVGRSWALVFARAGYSVSIWDKSQEQALDALLKIRQMLETLPGMTEQQDDILERIQVEKSIEAAAVNADYIQESVAENTDIKKQLFSELDAIAPGDCILASSSSAIPISDVVEGLPGRNRCLIVHPVNPPHVIPLVELCGSSWTSPSVIKRTQSFMQDVGQSPILLHKEVDGFVLNRLQWALLGEALHLVGEGYCSIEDIDKVLTDGLALRWAFMGPFETGHLNSSMGLEGYFHVLKEALARVQDSLQTDYKADDELVTMANQVLQKRIAIEDIPAHQLLRDQRVLSLREHLSESGKTI